MKYWSKILKTVVVMAGCISSEDYEENRDCFENINLMFGKVSLFCHTVKLGWMEYE